MKDRQRNYFDICETCNILCCQNVKPPITSNRKVMITNFTGSPNYFETDQYTYPKQDKDGFCVFFDKQTRKCRIQRVKPETCVAGPVTFDINHKTGKVEWYLKRGKICPLAGFLYFHKDLLQEHLRHAKKELLNLIKEISPKELKVLMEIEEKEIFKIAESDLSDTRKNKRHGV